MKNRNALLCVGVLAASLPFWPHYHTTTTATTAAVVPGAGGFSYRGQEIGAFLFGGLALLLFLHTTWKTRATRPMTKGGGRVSVVLPLLVLSPLTLHVWNTDAYSSDFGQTTTVIEHGFGNPSSPLYVAAVALAIVLQHGLIMRKQPIAQAAGRA